MEPVFPRVTNFTEKYFSYKTQMGRYQKAARQGFYFEGIFILYAVLEDRLSAFLFHAGVLSAGRDKFTTNKNVKPRIDVILRRDVGEQYKIRNISSKIKALGNLLEWERSFVPGASSKNYPVVLASQIRKVSGKGQMPSILRKIELWSQARNELVHALLNRNAEAMDPALAMLADEGYHLCRQLDNFVRGFKTRNTIRKTFNIQ